MIESIPTFRPARSVLLFMLSVAWFATSGPLAAQERPRPRRESREERRLNAERPGEGQKGESPDAASRDSKSPSSGGPSGQQVDDIQQSWMKELSAPGQAGAGGPADAGGSGGPAAGDTRIPETTGQPGPGGLFSASETPSFVGLLLRFLVIAGIMGGSLYVFVRFVKKRTGIVTAQEGPVEILASVPLMPGKFLQIVDLAGQIMVLGVSESGVRLVHIVDSSVTAERIRLWHQGRPRDRATSLLEVIQAAVRKGEFRFWGGERSKDRPDFLEMLNGETAPPSDVPPERLSELLKEQHRKIRRSTEPGAPPGGQP